MKVSSHLRIVSYRLSLYFLPAASNVSAACLSVRWYPRAATHTDTDTYTNTHTHTLPQRTLVPPRCHSVAVALCRSLPSTPPNPHTQLFAGRLILARRSTALHAKLLQQLCRHLHRRLVLLHPASAATPRQRVCRVVESKLVAPRRHSLSFLNLARLPTAAPACLPRRRIGAMISRKHAANTHKISTRAICVSHAHLSHPPSTRHGVWQQTRTEQSRFSLAPLTSSKHCSRSSASTRRFSASSRDCPPAGRRASDISSPCCCCRLGI